MKPNDCFYKIYKPSEYIADYCLAFLKCWEGEPPKGLVKSYFGFEAIPLDKEIIQKEPWLRDLNEQFSIDNIGILTMKPFNSYDWHMDGSRGVCVNMLLSHTQSHCFFGEQRDYINKNFCELEYSPKNFYIFNSQMPHCVFNFNSYRYIFSVEFTAHKDILSYEDVLTWIEKKN